MVPVYSPMLATPWPEPFVDRDWVFEVKWDGVRTIVTWDGRAVSLRSRAGNDATARYPELGGLRAAHPLVLDGEIVALDSSGRPSFERLQQRMNLSGIQRIGEAVEGVPVSCIVFDVLFDGAEIIAKPWEERRERLERLILPAPFVLSATAREDPEGMWSLVVDRGLEGIVGKHRASSYRPGARSTEWRKISRFRQLRAVVGGYLPGDGGRAGTFGSLLLGLWVPEGLRWVGAVGSGFDDVSLRAIREALDQMTIDRSPFIPDAAMPRGAIWVAPFLVAVVQYKEFTSVGRLRAPSFKGFSDDDPAGITWSIEGPTGAS